MIVAPGGGPHDFDAAAAAWLLLDRCQNPPSLQRRITAIKQRGFLLPAPPLSQYRDKAKRTRDSLPARFYRMMTGEEWDGQGHSYSLARKKYRRWEEDYQQRERERQQRKKRDYSKKKRPADDNARRQARRIAQREREKARQPWRQACPPTVRRATAVAL